MLGPTPAPPRPRSLLLGVCLDSQGTFLPQTCRWPVRAKSLGPLLPLSILPYELSARSEQSLPPAPQRTPSRQPTWWSGASRPEAPHRSW